MSRSWLVLSSAGAALVATYACSNEDILQGDGFVPDGRLPTEPPTVRPEGGTSCDGGDASCDAGSGRPDATAPPTGPSVTEAPNTCQTARAFGNVSGDTGSTKATTTGNCSEWVSVRATEDNNSAIGTPMKVKITLTPTGSDFDLYVYYDPVKDQPSCTFPWVSSATPGTGPESASLMWGEGNVANGSDDGRTIDMLVLRPGGCDAGTWSLLVEGNK